MSNEIQTVITILIVFAMVLLGIRTIKNYGIKSKNSASMFIGFIIGSLVGYYFLNSVICAFVGMLCKAVSLRIDCFFHPLSTIPIHLRTDSITLLKFPKKITGVIISH